MQVLKICKTNADQSVVVLLVEDTYMQSLGEFMDKMSRDWMLGEGQYASADPAADIEDGIDQADSLAKIRSVIKVASNTGGNMTESQRQACLKLMGHSRADWLLAPGWQQDAFKIIKMAMTEKLDKVTQPNGTSKWVTSPNLEFRQDILDAILGLPGDLEPAPSTIPSEDNLFDSPADIHEKLIALSTQGSELSDPMKAVIERTVQGGVKSCFPGGKRGAMDLFMQVANKSKRESRDSKNYIPNEDYREDFVTYLKRNKPEAEREVRF